MLKRQTPNALTVLRVVLSGVFFGTLGVYRYPSTHPEALVVACAVFVVAAVTDALDGHLARRWHVESTFGRIADPTADKLLIVGSFVCLAGPRFVDARIVEADRVDFMASGVYPWVTLLILGRELLVTAIRGELEGQGVKFGAVAWGKWKMGLQTVTVPALLIILRADPAVYPILATVRDVLIYVTVAVTLVSAVPYLAAAGRAFADDVVVARNKDKEHKST